MSSLNEKYWRSLSEYGCGAGVPPASKSAGGTPTTQDGLSRRRWLQLMGASLALAGAGGCRWEKTELLPMDKRPPGRIPGKLERFATAMDLGGSALGLLVTCVDGRPIKVEGNPKHAYSLGATNVYAQAAILELYDPDRSKNIIERTPQGHLVRTWDEFAAFAKTHFGRLRKTGGEGLAVLSDNSSSDTLATLLERLQRELPKAKCYDVRSAGSAARAASCAARLATGRRRLFVWMPICSDRSRPACGMRGTSPNGARPPAGR